MGPSPLLQIVPASNRASHGRRTPALVGQSETKNKLCLDRAVDEWQEVAFFGH